MIHGSSSEIVASAASNWWERSPDGSNSSDFCGVNSYGYAYNNDASNSYGVSFGLRNNKDRQSSSRVKSVSLRKENLFPAVWLKMSSMSVQICFSQKTGVSDESSRTLLAWRRLCVTFVSWLAPTQLEPHPTNHCTEDTLFL